MAKKEQEDKCPKCGCVNWLGTSMGILCKGCGYIKEDTDAPVLNKEKDDNN